MSAERQLVYVDSSALVKLVVEEPESKALEDRLGDGSLLATSRIALVEVPRATSLANPAVELQAEVERLLSSCMLIDVTTEVLRSAAALASRDVRTLDAIHLASALQIEPDELVAYDRRLLSAAAQRGLDVSSPAAGR